MCRRTHTAISDDRKTPGLLSNSKETEHACVSSATKVRHRKISKTNLLMEVANEIRDKRNEPLVRRESVKKFHGAIP
jgi:hypothetical protein